MGAAATATNRCKHYTVSVPPSPLTRATITATNFTVDDDDDRGDDTISDDDEHGALTLFHMRESNFAFPAQNRASVCISSQLYDRRGNVRFRDPVQAMLTTREQRWIRTLHCLCSIL